MITSENNNYHIVIVGGGFGGLYTAKTLANAPVKITLIDKRNFHLFQPLLYQVATGGLSPGDIASPLRAVFKNQRNIKVIQGEVVDINPDEKKVAYDKGELNYDTLIIATGARSYFFGHDDWADKAFDLKTVEDAVEIRRQILNAFEEAEYEKDIQRQKSLMTFVVVGGGPTGVELAGALAELCRQTLKDDFRTINPAKARVILIEASDRLLPSYPTRLSIKAQKALSCLGVIIRTETTVTAINGEEVKLQMNAVEETIPTSTVLWAAGIRASLLGKVLADKVGVSLDRLGRVMVQADLSVGINNQIFVIGDLACVEGPDNKPLPGVAPVAMQQGKYVARLINNRLRGVTSSEPFKFHNKGSLAVIGRNAAVAWFGRFQLAGFWAWLVWVFVHIGYLIEYDNKLLVLIQWAWNYFTRKKGARLITTSWKKENNHSHPT